MQACPALARSSVRHSSSKLDSALAAPLIAFSDIVATRQSSSKLDSALAAPLIADLIRDLLPMIRYPHDLRQ